MTKPKKKLAKVVPYVALLEFRLLKQKQREINLLRELTNVRELLWLERVGVMLGEDLEGCSIDTTTGAILRPINPKPSAGA